MVTPDLAAKAKEASPGSQADSEVRAVIAHELSHIYDFDSLTGTAIHVSVSTVLLFGAAATAWPATQHQQWVGTAALATGMVAAVWLLGRALVRRYEYAADRGAARVLGQGRDLVAALRPFGDTRPVVAAFAAHPPTSKRIRRLERHWGTVT